MILTFDTAAVRALLQHAQAATTHEPTYGQLFELQYRKPGREGVENPTRDDVDFARIPAGLYLVGDHGVYLMSNADRGAGDQGRPPVAYARETNPNELEFDQWWSAKRASFGADDGVEFLDARESIEPWLERARGDTVQIDVTPTSIRLVLG